MKESCNHNNIRIIEDNAYDKLGVCEDCGLEIPIFSLKEGLYAMKIEKKVYLINSMKDMDLEQREYQFQLRNSNQSFHLFRCNKQTQREKGTCKKLCKTMKNQ